MKRFGIKGVQHDDLVLAAAICYAVRGQQQYTVDAEDGERAEWTADQWEDYRSADEETRKMMVRQWGAPRG